MEGNNLVHTLLQSRCKSWKCLLKSVLQVEENEKKISNLLSGKMDMVFQMKEEVESEYAERMEGLRDIYRWQLELVKK